MSKSVVSPENPPVDLGDLQLPLYEQAAAAKMMAALLDQLMQDGSELEPIARDVMDGFVTVCHGIARTCSETAESLYAFQRQHEKDGALFAKLPPASQDAVLRLSPESQKTLLAAAQALERADRKLVESKQRESKQGKSKQGGAR